MRVGLIQDLHRIPIPLRLDMSWVDYVFLAHYASASWDLLVHGIGVMLTRKQEEI